MIGFAGLLLTSATGENVRWMPTACASSAVTRPSSKASSSRPVAPNAIAMGNSVPPTSRIPLPHSRSAPINRGSRARCCNAFSLAATSSGGPIEMMIPPTPSESIHTASVSYSALSNAA